MKTADSNPERIAAEEIRRTLHTRRLEFGLTQAWVANKARINRSKLSLYENGTIDLSEAELGRIRKALSKFLKGAPGVSLRELLTQDLTSPSPYKQREKAWLEQVRADISKKESRKMVRLEMGLSQHALARSMGISQSKLSLWELGRTELTPDENQRWRQALLSVQRENLEDDPWFKLKIAHENEVKLARENAALKERLSILEKLVKNLDDLTRALTEKSDDLEAQKADAMRRVEELRDLMDVSTKAALLRDKIIESESEPIDKKA